MIYKILLVLCYGVYFHGSNAGECEPIFSLLTSPKTGQKAWDKCLEYQEKLVYPCEKTPEGGSTRVNQCQHKAQNLILQSIERPHHEFSHMALLGIIRDSKPNWKCTGSLISDKFILTVAHCTNSYEFGPVEHAYIGTLGLGEEADPSKMYSIKTIIKHPDFKPPLGYNDIALLETDKLVELNKFTVPICLHVGDPNNLETATVTSYGLYKMPAGTAPGVLQKVALTKFTTEECSAIYPSSRHFTRGIDKGTQLCFGERNSTDSCPSESGSPLQIENKNISCMHTVIGLTTVGGGCQVDRPIVYTLVAHFVPWIESIVWP